MALLNPIFGSLGDNVQREARKVLHEQHLLNDDFPANEINSALAEAGKSPDFDDYAIERFLKIEYRTRTSLLALSLLYDENSWGMLSFQQDHIFPKSLFTVDYMTEAGIESEKQTRFLNLFNRVGNLELLLDAENAAKSNKDFADWLPTRDSTFRQRHLIPDDDSVLEFTMFEEFIEAREALIKDRLQCLLDL